MDQENIYSDEGKQEFEQLEKERLEKERKAKLKVLPTPHRTNEENSIKPRYQLNSAMNYSNRYLYNSARSQHLIVKSKYVLNPIKEGLGLVPRFSIKNNEIFPDFPANKIIPYDQQKLIKAIKYGMIILLLYKGEKDNWRGGRERTIYPMVLGKSSKGKILLRGYHLKGWSVSVGRETDKIWRLFRMDRVKSMMFTGSFFRLPPDGYKMNDSIMKKGIIAAADFSAIRRNQQQLVNSQLVQSPSEAIIGSQDAVPSVSLENTKTQIDLNDLWTNPYISKKDAPNIRISVLKPLFGGADIIVVGALGEKGKNGKLYDGTHPMGVYKVVDSFMADAMTSKPIDGKTKFDLYAFKNFK